MTKKRHVIGLALCAAFLSTIFIYGNGGHRAVREHPLFFTSEMIGKHLEGYSEEEKREIEKDLNVVRDVCFPSQEVEKTVGRRPLYLATAGAPGARKSTILERFLHSHPEYDNAVYVDPDQRALKFMVHTYYAESLSAYAAASTENYISVQKAAYTKWRPASNYIALTLLEEAFAKRADIVYGTTSTGGHVADFLYRLKASGYQTTIVLCSCEDGVRKSGVEYRNQEQRFYQCTPEDVVEKGLLFPERMAVYFRYADTLYVYWSDSIFTPERLGAVLTEGQITLYDREAFQAFVDKYEQDRVALAAKGTEIPGWEELMSLYQSRQYP